MLVVCVFQGICLFHLSSEIYGHSVLLIVLIMLLMSVVYCHFSSCLILHYIKYQNLFHHSVIVELLGYFCFFTVMSMINTYVYTAL